MVTVVLTGLMGDQDTDRLSLRRHAPTYHVSVCQYGAVCIVPSASRCSRSARVVEP